MVERSKDPWGVWVFRISEEKWEKECIHGVLKRAKIKLVAWACIWGRSKRPLIPIFDKSVNRWIYIRVLKDGLIDTWQEAEDTIEDPVFHQGNAKIHIPADTIAWLEENRIQVMKWPPNSPDINPIQHCWKRLKKKMNRRFPNIHKTKGGPDTVRICLAVALNEVWMKDIKGDFLERLWESMPMRVAAILDSKGWYTKYWFFKKFFYF